MYYDPKNVDLDGNPLRIDESKINDYHVNYSKLRAGVIAVESANGKLLKNETRSTKN